MLSLSPFNAPSIQRIERKRAAAVANARCFMGIMAPHSYYCWRGAAEERFQPPFWCRVPYLMINKPITKYSSNERSKSGVRSQQGSVASSCWGRFEYQGASGLSLPGPGHMSRATAGIAVQQHEISCCVSLRGVTSAVMMGLVTAIAMGALVADLLYFQNRGSGEAGHFLTPSDLRGLDQPALVRLHHELGALIRQRDSDDSTGALGAVPLDVPSVTKFQEVKDEPVPQSPVSSPEPESDAGPPHTERPEPLTTTWTCHHTAPWNELCVFKNLCHKGPMREPLWVQLVSSEETAEQNRKFKDPFYPGHLVRPGGPEAEIRLKNMHTIMCGIVHLQVEGLYWPDQATVQDFKNRADPLLPYPRVAFQSGEGPALL